MPGFDEGASCSSARRAPVRLAGTNHTEAPAAPPLQRLLYDARAGRCCRGLEALGGPLRVELLALPPAPRKAGGWLVRQVRR